MFVLKRYENGGIYFDTDVELKKNPDFLLEYKSFFGLEKGAYVNTGLGFGAEKGVGILLEMMQDYNDIPFVKENGSYDVMPCPERNTKVFLEHGLIQNDTKQLLDNGILILPTAILNPMNFETGQIKITAETVSIHWYSASWHTKKEQREHRKHRIRTRIIKVADKIIPDAVLKMLLNEYLYDIFKQKANNKF